MTKIVVMPSFALQRANVLAQPDPDVRVERRQRLVEQQDLRARGERAGERHALLLAARKLVRIAAGEVRQLDERQHLVDPRLDLGRRLPGDLEAEADVALDRHIGKERIGLEHHADRAAAGAEMRDVPAVDADRSGGRRLEAGDHPQGRRLAAAAGAQEGHELAALDREVEVLARRPSAPKLLRMPVSERNASIPSA